ncbi:putative ribonuclease H-like domain-containing protein [Tanacetum coccineum]
MTLIEAVRTMLADSKFPTTFWAEAINTACYVQNIVLVVKPHNKTPYELFHGRTPTLSFMRPFGCPITILNTIDHLCKFDGKADEGLFVGYSLNSKAFRVFNSRTRIVEENLHIRFSESTPNNVGSGPDWLFDIDALTRIMNYELIVAEVIDYDEVFAPVARIEAIRLFLAYASFKDFVVYQMDVKSAFLYGKIEEEVYVCQPLGFKDPKFPDRVYKVEKALHGLHQAPRAWYETLSTYMLDNGFQRGKIDKTLFIKRHKGDILLVQVYVDNIIFGSKKKELFTEVKTASTPIETQKPLLKDEDGEEVDVHMYRSMIGSLMYLTSLRPDIMFVVCAYARYQVNPKILHLFDVKRIFRTMSSPNRSTSDIEDAFSSMNILNYTSVSSDSFPASLGSNPITPPAILTPSPVLPPSLLFDPRYFFIPEELLPPKKRICSSSSSSTTLSNSSRNQTCDLPGKHRLMPMASDSNLTGTPCSENGNYKEFISCQPSLLMVRKAQ